MTRLKLSIRSALFHWRAHLSVLAGAAIAGAVLVGAMLVGDSVRFSLGRAALLRLGNIHHAMHPPGRFFGQELTERIDAEAKAGTAAALLLPGIAEVQDDTGSGSRQANNIQVVGIDDRFSFFAGRTMAVPGKDEIAVNAKLAAQLRVKAGDRVSIRVGKPSLLPRDAPLSSRSGDGTSRGTFTVARIVGDDELGRFSLAANQVVPCNAFVSLAWLQKAADLPGKANLVVAGAYGGTTSSAPLNAVVRKVWRLEDAGLNLREVAEQGILQLESDRIFMEPAVSKAALELIAGSTGEGVSLQRPSDGAADVPPGVKSVGALTYLVNSISVEVDGVVTSTPYSFVIGLSPSPARGIGPVPAGMADDEIILNSWLAERLSTTTGGTVRVAYYELTPSNKFVEKSRTFRVRAILGMSEIAAEKDLGPKFPGLTDVERCAEWDIGMPLDKDKVEDKANEAYWDAYRATPKAFITLGAGQAMWANRFGDMSAVRYPAGAAGGTAIAEALKRRLDPEAMGLSFVPVRMLATKAAGEAMDFGQLFLGMSFFLIVAGLMLTGLLFAFGVEQRAAEIGVLLAVGYRRGQVRRLLMMESCLVAGLGAVIGAGLGILYTKVLIWGLANYWQGAVANSAIQYHAEPLTVVAGAVACFVCAMVSMALAMRRQSARPARELLAAGAALSAVTAPAARKPGRMLVLLPWAGVVAAIGIIAAAVETGAQNAVPSFFAAGALLLLAGLGLIRLLLVRLDRAGAVLTIALLGIRNAGRRRARSVTVAAMLACGCFLVFAVSAMREDVGADSDKRSSGTGGFAMFGESTIPLQDDLNSEDGRKKLRLDSEPLLKDAGIVTVKVRDGDDASCLNLNRAQTPRLLGVDPDEFAGRKAFVRGKSEIWDLLKTELPGGVVPGLVGDENTAMWGLQKKVGRDEGDTLIFRNERGEEFKVKLVGALPMRLSVFQGSVLIPARSFSAHYPSESGYRMLLIDVPPGAGGAVKDLLTRRLGRLGLDLVPTVDRLREFYAVESTYMTMFLVLGGLGLILGSAGMVIVVMRNILERRGELGLLKAVGYSNSQLRMVLLVEHWLILALGLALGFVSSLAAMWPSMTSPDVTLPWGSILLIAGGIAALNLLWILATVYSAIRGSPVTSLRSE